MKPLVFLSLTPAALLASCAIAGSDYEKPQPTLPENWSTLEAPAAPESSAATSESADLSLWWKAFGDESLASLIEQALASNLDLREAGARVREARAFWSVARGALAPAVTADAGYQRTRWSENGPFPGGGSGFDLYQAGFDASWEIDLFGGRQRELEAADADLAASVESLRDAQVSLLAEVARNWVEILGTRSRLAIARQNLEIQRKTADWTKARVESGWANDLDLTRSQAQVAVTASTIPSLEAALRQAIHRLSVLLGRPPGAPIEELAAESPLPVAPASIPLGLPTDLLRRRPDLRRAERELAAASARVGVATAELYPKFFLTGSYGAESVDGDDLLRSASRAWSLGPSVRWSLFEGGRIRARIEARDAQHEQAALRFEKTLLGALREIEDGIVAHSREQRRRDALAQAFASQRRAAELAEQRYAQGLVDLLIVLDAQRLLFAAQDALVQSEQSVASNAIALYKAVGGGWKPE